MASSKVISLKLLIDTNSKKLLYAEAGKDFVDFLFYLMVLPVGTVIDLLKKEGMVGCLGNLYKSIEILSGTYMAPTRSKDSLLKPRSSVAPTECPLMLSAGGNSNGPQLYFSSNSSCVCVTDVSGIQCHCHAYAGSLSKQARFVGGNTVSSSFGVGFVKEVSTYMVMDDLRVQPMSSGSIIITLLKDLNIREVGCLEEKVVNFGLTEALKLLKASFQSKTVLTNVFLNN